MNAEPERLVVGSTDAERSILAAVGGVCEAISERRHYGHCPVSVVDCLGLNPQCPDDDNPVRHPGQPADRRADAQFSSNMMSRENNSDIGGPVGSTS